MRVAIVLAAGSSRRFGSANKLLARLRGRPLLTWALAAAHAAPVAQVIVVTGTDPRRVAALARRGGRVRVVHARRHREGLAASLAAGVAAAPSTTREALVFLGDMPCVPGSLAGRLVRARGGQGASIRPIVAGTPGHPVLLARCDFAAVAALSGDRGPAALLASRGARGLRLSACWRAALADVDRRRDVGR